MAVFTVNLVLTREEEGITNPKADVLYGWSLTEPTYPEVKMHDGTLPVIVPASLVTGRYAKCPPKSKSKRRRIFSPSF